MSEQVMCIRRELFNMLDIKQGFTSCTYKISNALFLIDKHKTYVNKDYVEEADEYVQIVTYNVVRHNNYILSYARGNKEGDKRLHSKLSLGIGGHVNSNDTSILNGACRELQEELGADGQPPIIRGIIYDDSNKVGRVHLGVVYRVNNAYGDISPDCILPAVQFLNLRDILNNFKQYETWSQILIMNYANL